VAEREELQKKFTVNKLKTVKGKIVTGSMEPLLPIGTEILIRLKDHELKRFDIIVFQSDGKLICHFLWQQNKIVKPLLLQTRNLKNLGTDFPIGQTEYFGKVISHKLRFRDKLRIFLNQIFH
jgi:hypothetical protein